MKIIAWEPIGMLPDTPKDSRRSVNNKAVSFYARFNGRTRIGLSGRSWPRLCENVTFIIMSAFVRLWMSFNTWYDDHTSVPFV